MSAGDWQAFFSEVLDGAQRANVRRSRSVHVEGDDLHTQFRNGQRLINFGSNDYLGLRRDRRLALAVERALPTLGVGSGASPLVSGYSSALAELEQRIAAWQGTEAALVFSSGMAMNIGVVAALVEQGDLVLSDRLNHASLIDGCRLSGASKRIYLHANAQAVEDLLRTERGRFRRALVITESVFSMDGDVAPLAELADICWRYDTGLIVDEAHASGLFGPSGAGLGEHLNATTTWLAKLGTFSKALGTCGGFVAGSRGLIDFLVNRCRSYIYSTAISPTVVAATLASIELMPSLTEQRLRLHTIGQHIRSELKQQGWLVPDGSSPIVPIIVGTSERALAISRELLDAGLFVPAIRPPTVPEGGARLRISLSSSHSDQQLSELCRALAALVDRAL